MRDFRTLPGGPTTLADVLIPACLLGELVRRDVSIRDGRIAGGGARGAGGLGLLPRADLERARLAPAI